MTEFRLKPNQAALILESTQEGIFAVDTDGVVTFVNDSATSMLEYERSEILGKPIHALIHHSHKNGSPYSLKECPICHAYTEGVANTIDDEVLWRKSGTSIEVEYTSTPLLQDDVIIGAVVVFRDIGERKKAAEEFRKREEHFSSLVQNIPGAVYRCVSDENWTMDYISERIEEITGYPASDYLQNKVRSYASIIHPDDVEMVNQAVDMGLQEDRLYLIEYRIVRADGAISWVFEKGRVLPDGQLLEGVIFDITDRKEAELELSKLSSAITQSPVSVVITDTAGDIEYVNPKFTQITGYSTEEVYGHNPSILKSESHPPEFYKDLWDTITAGKEWRGEFCNRKKSGKLYWVQASISPIRNTAGQVTHYVGVEEDITERLRSEEEINRINFLADSALDLTHSGYWEIDYDDPDFYISSERAAAIFGELPKSLHRYHLQDEWYDRIEAADPEIAKKTAEHYAAAVEGRIPRYDVTYPYMRPEDGRTVWIRAIGSVVRDENGKAKHMYGVAQDITDSKRMENEIRRINFLSDSALELTRTGYWEIDYDDPGFYISSERTAAILGEPPKSLHRYNQQDEWYDRIEAADPEIATQIWDIYGAVIEGRRPLFDVSYPYMRPVDGRIVWIRSIGSVVRDESGAARHMYGVVQDVTDQKQAQENIRLAREAAEEANLAKSQFLANMSHELRTPMNAIIGYSELLMEEAEDLEQEEFVSDLKKIRSAGKHLLALINDVLDLSKIEAGKMDVYPETFTIEHLLDEINSTVDALVRKKNNTFELNFAGPLGIMHTDLTKVRQVLFNLISNAVKFTENGNIIFSIRRETVEDQDWIEFGVSDTGIGIAADKLGILFDEFVQADDSTTRNFGGTGLGLAISKRFCKMLGGTITVESQPGIGSTFTIRLPAQLAVDPADTEKVDESEDVIARTKTATSASPAECQPGPMVLVIDDDADMLDMMQRFLQKQGFQVTTASGGEEGLRLAKELHPAAITLDVLMPHVDGWQVLKTLKSEPETNDIPVIIITMLSDKSMGYSLGALELMTKPINRHQLLQVLQRCCPSPSTQPILVVDDDLNIREMFSRLLTKEGWRVLDAENGKVALEQVGVEIPAMIFLDLMMPVMDGFAFIKKLRSKAIWREIPIIVITSKDVSHEEITLLENNVVTILQKGAYTRQELLEQVNATITHHLSKDY